MATLAQQRAQIAAGMRASRQGTSEASRRATGEAMVSRRTGRNEVEDLNAVITQPRQRRTLRSVEPRGSVPAQVGRGNYTAPPATGGGLAWPLTEDDAETRVFWASQVISSADGLVAIQIKPLRTMMLRDANDSSGALSLAEP